MVLLNVRLFVGVLALVLAEAEDASQSVEQRSGAAKQAEEQQEKQPKNHTDDDSGNGASAEATAALLDWNESSIYTGRDRRLEGKRGRRSASVRDVYHSRAGRTHRGGRSHGGENASRRATGDQGAFARNVAVEATVAAS